MYVIARNPKGRPTLQHKLAKDNRHTGCGKDLQPWSCAYQRIRMDPILCKQKGCR